MHLAFGIHYYKRSIANGKHQKKYQKSSFFGICRGSPADGIGLLFVS